MVEIPEHGDQYHRIWVELIRLAAEAAAPWSLIGSQMVHLHGWIAGVSRPSLSTEADILANSVQAITAPRQLSQQLVDSGYALGDRSVLGTGHLFVRGEVALDVLAPEKTSERNRQTWGGQATVAVPGGRQALNRTIRVDVRTRDVTGQVPVPNLLGAILIKARAIGVSSRPESQREDFAFLLSLITGLKQAEAFRAQLEGGQRSWLRAHQEVADPQHHCWRNIRDSNRGVVAYRRLVETTSP